MSEGIRNYRDLRVWQAAIGLGVEVYRLTNRLPSNERFALAVQMRRAAVSVASNIAEGHGRHHRAEYVQHLSIARGSLNELETHVELLERVDYMSANELRPVRDSCAQTGRMLSTLIKRLRP